MWTWNVSWITNGAKIRYFYTGIGFGKSVIFQMLVLIKQIMTGKPSSAVVVWSYRTCYLLDKLIQLAQVSTAIQFESKFRSKQQQSNLFRGFEKVSDEEWLGLLTLPNCILKETSQSLVWFLFLIILRFVKPFSFISNQLINIVLIEAHYVILVGRLYR